MDFMTIITTKVGIFKLGFLLVLWLVMLVLLFISYTDSSALNKTPDPEEYIISNGANDIVIFTPSIDQGRWNYYDAGIGIDTFWLRLTEKEIQNPRIQADILRFYYFLMNNSDILRSAGTGDEFSFSAFDLRLRNFENLVVERIEPYEGKESTLKVAEPLREMPIRKNDDAINEYMG
jgi:hypothetical protein